jgi:hypothetical protein
VSINKKKQTTGRGQKTNKNKTKTKILISELMKGKRKSEIQKINISKDKN